MEFGDEALRADLRILDTRLRDMGAFERPVFRIVSTWVCAYVVAIVGLYGAVASNWPVYWRLLSAVVSAAASITVFTIGHTASHGAACKTKFGNQLLTYLSYPLHGMMSAQYWHNSHIRLHHAAPNVIGADPDCDLRPVFGVNQEHARQLPRWMARVQALIILLVLPLNGFNIQRQGWMYLIAALSDPRKRRPALWVDLATMLAHLAIFLFLPMIWLTPQVVVTAYLARVSILGTLLFGVLAPGHFPAEAAVLHSSQQRREHFWFRQTATTVNFRTGFIGRILCSGLEYQIEHHLMPRINHVHLPRVSPLVRELCQRHGLPHRTLGWGEAIVASWKVFLDPKPIVADIRSLRVPPPQESFES